MTQLRIAAVLLWFNGIGFGMFCPPAIARVLQDRPLPRPFGFPAYGEGPFESHGIPTTAPLLAGFLVVCILEVVAGLLLWTGQRSGAILALALLLPGAIYWWGFALPVPWLFAVARTVLILLGWHSLR
ncbi:MAG TPA: hypothetical protein VKA30_03460 [Actinomycetota bacterium]|nr:hypothetical protein [Actinomycetota bacterium]